MAAVLTTVAFVPQVWQTWRTKSAGDLHVWTLASFTLGVFLWTIYGVWAGAWPVILANGVTLLLQIPLLAMKVHYRKR
jgi:MtN3 and saliva related transmembrane protein